MVKFGADPSPPSHLINNVIKIGWTAYAHATEKWPIDNWNCYIRFRDACG